MLRCEICGEPLRAIGKHVNIHGITLADYQARYPGSPLITPSASVLHGRGGASQAQARRDAHQGQAPDHYLAEFLTGALLGDGHLECRKKNARYAEGGNNEAYLRWKHSVLQRYFPTAFTQRLSAPHVRSGKRYLGWWIKTATHPLLTEAHKAWYLDGVKRVSVSIVEQHLTEFALAVWFCDDGHALKNGSTANLYTMGFQLNDVEFLQELLLRRFGLSTSILFNKKRQPFLQFGRASRIVLQAILRRFSLPGMEYKALPSETSDVVGANGLRPAVVENVGDDVYVVIGVSTDDHPTRVPTCRMRIRRRSRYSWILEVDGRSQERVWSTLRAARCAATAVEVAAAEGTFGSDVDTKKRERGQYVKTLVNAGAGMAGLQIGVVTRAGTRQYTVCWEGSHRRCYPQGYGHELMDWRDWPDEACRKVQDEIFRHCGI